MHMRHGNGRAFSIVEVLVVIGLITILLGLLMPTLSKARRRAQTVQCQSNMRQVGLALDIYANRWKGWVYPVLLGCNVPREQRWPTQVFKPAVWNPPVMKCPADELPPPPAVYVGVDKYKNGDENGADHSYILNELIKDRYIKKHSTAAVLAGVSSSEVIIMAEKKTHEDDYYHGIGPFHKGTNPSTLLESYRHGLNVGSNYLFLDGHVETLRPEDAVRPYDPWTAAGLPAAVTW